MNERQKELIKQVQDSLDCLLSNASAMGPYGPAQEEYNLAISKLCEEFKNAETLNVGIDIMDRIYQEKSKTKFPWLNDIEKATKMAMSFMKEEN